MRLIRPARATARPFALALLATTGLATAASAQSVRWTLLPSANYVRWHDDVGLENATLLGGRAVADFGEFIGVEGFYLTQAGDLATRRDVPPGGPAAGDGGLRLANYGLGLRLNFGREESRVAPFLRGGASVFRFQPRGGDATQFLALTYGGGLRVNLTPRLRAQLFAEDARMRLDREALAPPGTVAPDPNRDVLRSNLVFGAGLGMVLGPPLLRDGRGGRRWNTASFPVEPFVGRMTFAGSNLATQSLVGIRAGVDAHELVGLRGYYWSGVAPSYRSMEPVRSFGLEAQFNLNRAPVLAPYLVLGGGTIDFREAYRDEVGDAREDQTVVILGGGVGLRLTDQFRLNVAARDYLSTANDDFGGAARASQLRHNWLLSAGLTLNLGRGRRGVYLARTPSPADSAARLAAATPARRAGPDTVVVRDTIYVRDAGGDVELMEPVSAAGVRQRDVSGRTVTIPVPVEGELYVRYGRSGESTVLRTDRGELRRASLDDAVDRLAASLVVPTRRDSTGALVADTAALRATIRRMVAEELRGSTDGASMAPPARSAAPAAMSSPMARDSIVRADAPRTPRMLPQADSLVVRDLVQRELEREVQRRMAFERQEAAAPPVWSSPPPLTWSAPPPTTDRTVVVRDDPLAFGPDGESLRAAMRLVDAERERSRVEVSRLRAQVDSLEARRDTLAAVAVRDELRRVEAASARVEADADAAAAALREVERRATESERERRSALQRLQQLVAGVAEVRETEQGLLVVLGDGAFASGRTALAAGARGALGVVAAALVQHPAERLVVSGHTDDTGAAITNLRLSEQRAQAVRDALVLHGIAPERVEVRGHGETMPVADNATAAGRARNRRAELLLVGSELARGLRAP